MLKSEQVQIPDQEIADIVDFLVQQYQINSEPGNNQIAAWSAANKEANGLQRLAGRRMTI